MKKLIISIISIPVLIILILAVNYFIFQHIATQISVGVPIMQKDIKKQALLVIDIQEGTTGKSSVEDYYIMKSHELINNINQIADSSNKNKVPVIYIKSEITNFLINILNDTYAPGSPGSKFDTRLNLVSDIIINKDKSDAFCNPALDSFLIKNEINKLVFTGLDLAHCINSTILAAENRNYDICLISDAVLAKSDSLKKVKLHELKQSGFEIISSNEYLDKINYD
jgi:nicotinamidase-related amidase